MVRENERPDQQLTDNKDVMIGRKAMSLIEQVQQVWDLPTNRQ